MIPTTTTAIFGQVDLLVGRRWLVTGATGTVRDPAAFPAYMRFTYSGDARGTLEVSGCENGAYPVEYQLSQVLDVGQPSTMQTCEGSDDIGQELWKILALPLRWSVVGHELTLTPTTPSEYSLVLTETEDSVALTEVVGARAVSEALASARIRWSDAGIASYGLTIAEDRSVWSRGCVWNIAVSDGVVTESEGFQTSAARMGGDCNQREWTVEHLHDVIAFWLDDLSNFAAPEFGEHTLVVQFNDIGVPVVMEYDLANGQDEEASMRVTLTATE